MTDMNNNNLDKSKKSNSNETLSNDNRPNDTNPKYSHTEMDNYQNETLKFTNWHSELNTKKYKASIKLKLLLHKIKVKKISFVFSIIIIEAEIITLKMETLIQNKKNVYLTMIFLNLKNLNIALSWDKDGRLN